MKLALHIGTARTGTTSLQVWCAANRGGLGEQGVCYPLSPGNENHRRLMVYALDTAKADGSFPKLGINSAEDHEAFRSQMREDLRREMATSRASGHRAWLMSSEHLHSKINTPAMIARLYALLRPHFDEIMVYVHLRPQVDLLISNATQRARTGKPVNRAELTRSSVSANSSYFNYNKVIGYWEDVFGPENLRIIPYRRIPDITGFLSDELGVDRKRLPPAARVNSGLDWRAIALANVVHSGFAARNLGNPPEYHLNDMPGAERIQMGLLLAQEVQARFDISNSKLSKRRSDIAYDDLQPDWSEHDEVGNLTLVEAPCLFADQLTHMVRRFAQDRAMERWRRHIAEGRLAALTGDGAALDRAKRAAEDAAAELDALGLLPETVASVEAAGNAATS